MTHPPVLALGYSEAAMLLRQPGQIKVGAVISIVGQREYAVEASDIRHHLVLNFDDTEAPNPNDALHAARISLRQREAAAIGLKLNPPSRDDARRIIEFARSIRDIDGTLLCHCQGGVSRLAGCRITLFGRMDRSGP